MAVRMLVKCGAVMRRNGAIVAENHCIGHIEMGMSQRTIIRRNDLLIDSKLYEKLSMIVELSMKLTFATRIMSLLLSAIQER